MSARDDFALRATTVFLVRIKDIRTKNTVMDKGIPGKVLPHCSTWNNGLRAA